MSGIVDAEKVVRVSNGVTMSELQGTTDAVEKSDRKVILFLGRLAHRKGFFDLIHALASLRRQGHDVELWAGGDGDLDHAMAVAREHNVADAVRILGWIGEEEKSDALRRAWVFCLPSYAEGLPMALLEAMGAGVPVVTTRVGGIPEAVDDGCEGYLIKPGDREELQKALASVLDDQELRRQMGVAARLRVETTFSLRSTVQVLEGVYEELGARRISEHQYHDAAS